MVVINDFYPPNAASCPESHSATSIVIAKGKRKAMGEPEEISLPRTPPRPQANPQGHLQSFSPDNIAIRYSPKLVQRMQKDNCFKCHKQGHWAVDCPMKSHNNGDFTKIYCRCGHGFCEVRTANNERNMGRKYYVCPIKRGKKCSNWIKWCDDPVSESDLHPPPYKYPACSQCNAGVCRKEKEVNGPNAGRYYFACPVPEEHGNCGFRFWEDDVLNTANFVPVRQSCQKNLHYFWEPTNDNNVDSENCAISVVPAQQSCRRTLRHSWEPTDDSNDLNEGVDDVDLEHSKRMSIMDDSQHMPINAESKVPNRDETTLNEASGEKGEQNETTGLSVPSDHDGFPKFEVANNFQDVDMPDSVLRDAIVEKALSLSASSKILSQHKESEGQNSAMVNGASGGVSPSFHAIVVHEQESTRHSSSVPFNQLVISNPDRHMQCLTSTETEVSRNVVCPNGSGGKGRKPMSKAERQRQLALVAQQQLLDDLGTLNPFDHESMREAAEATFDVLNRLSIDYTHFSEHVLEFIYRASSLAEIEKSIEIYGSPEEQVQRCRDVEARLENIRNNHVKTKASLEVSRKHSQSFGEEVSRLKNMLYEMENRLISSQEETLKLEIDLTDINRNMVEVERNLQEATEQAEAARKLDRERQVRQSAAKAALEKAKLEVGKGSFQSL